MGENEDEVIGAGRFIELRRRGRWEFATRASGHRVVAIVAITDADEIVLVEQHRPPVDRRMIELPAGLAGDGQHAGEPGEAAARRELEEETGYRAETWRELATLHASAGLTDEAATLWLARDLKRVGPGGGVEGEDIEVHLVPRAEAVSWLAGMMNRGRGVDARVHAGLLLARG